MSEDRMNRESTPARIEFSLSVPLVPWTEEEQFAHQIIGKAVGDDGSELGRISLTLISTTEGTNRDFELIDLFGHDEVLEAVYEDMFDELGDNFDELDIEPSWSNFLYINEIQFTTHPVAETLRGDLDSQRSLAAELVETSMATFCAEGLVVAEEAALPLTPAQWRELGFRRIYDAPWIYRDQLKLNPYDYPQLDYEDEATYTCDGCGEEIVIPLDLSQGSEQVYVEDCPVCCRANVIHVDIDLSGNVSVWAEPEQDF